MSYGDREETIWGMSLTVGRYEAERRYDALVSPGGTISPDGTEDFADEGLAVDHGTDAMVEAYLDAVGVPPVSPGFIAVRKVVAVELPSPSVTRAA